MEPISEVSPSRENDFAFKSGQNKKKLTEGLLKSRDKPRISIQLDTEDRSSDEGELSAHHPAHY
jgi:hypothetical protein